MIDRRRMTEIADYCRLLHSQGWVANHDGNISVRELDGRFIASPTAWSKRLVEADDLIVIDRAGKVLRGKRRLFSEWKLHRAIFDARPDAGAVVHAHPPTISGFALAHQAIGPIASAEFCVSLGPEVPSIAFDLPGSETLEKNLARAAERFDAIVLNGHGAITLGDDLEQAYLRMELLEHYARQLLVARQLGGEQALSATQREPLLKARSKAGLGPEARGLAQN